MECAYVDSACSISAFQYIITCFYGYMGSECVWQNKMGKSCSCFYSLVLILRRKRSFEEVGDILNDFCRLCLLITSCYMIAAIEIGTIYDD